jgi:hypothetical protein
MKVGELTKILESIDDKNMDIFIDERLTEFKYGLVNGANVKEINFTEDPEPDPDSDVFAKETVLVLSED